MTVFYIPITDHNADNLDQLFDSLRPFTKFSTRMVFEVTTEDESIKPLLTTMADHVRYIAAPVEPVAILSCPDCGKKTKTGRRCRSCAMKNAHRRRAKRAKEEDVPPPETVKEETFGPGVQVVTLPRDEIPRANRGLVGTKL